MDDPCLKYNSLRATEVLVNDPETTQERFLHSLKLEEEKEYW